MELMARAVTCPVTSSDLGRQNDADSHTDCRERYRVFSPDDVKEGHQKLDCVELIKLGHCAQGLLEDDKLLHEVLGVGVLMAVGVPQVAPLANNYALKFHLHILEVRPHTAILGYYNKIQFQTENYQYVFVSIKFK